MRPTTDLSDELGDDAATCFLQFRRFGTRAAFEGVATTVRCHHDNVIVKSVLGEPGGGRVLVVDGGGSLERALMGDLIAELAVGNGWEGVIINGAVRDSAALDRLDLGIRALGTQPRRSDKHGVGERDSVVQFGGCTFHPGDTVVCDEDGILVIPAR